MTTTRADSFAMLDTVRPPRRRRGPPSACGGPLGYDRRHGRGLAGVGRPSGRLVALVFVATLVLLAGIGLLAGQGAPTASSSPGASRLAAGASATPDQSAAGTPS